ncbi:hypothetical protein SDE12394_08105 [Streptococcus dysgalactiae subsp. equisimilis ATCC 12394]|nr:hypothetical protein SDE12394_08105 [Streptococcus dysgalactiae subsp. equisimilis ATCC 12394]
MTSVSPFAGEWIEITLSVLTVLAGIVSPFAGEWIEMPFDKT